MLPIIRISESSGVPGRVTRSIGGRIALIPLQYVRYTAVSGYDLQFVLAGNVIVNGFQGDEITYCPNNGNPNVVVQLGFSEHVAFDFQELIYQEMEGLRR